MDHRLTNEDHKSKDDQGQTKYKCYATLKKMRNTTHVKQSE